MSDENENFAILLVNDAIKREEGLYYEGDDGMAHTCWETGEYARKVGLQLRSVSVTNALSALALLDLVLSAIAVPSLPGFEGMAASASYLQFLIWAIFVAVAAIRTYFMWGFRRNWFKGAAEPVWLCVQLFVLTFGVPTEFLIDAAMGVTEMRQSDTRPPNTVFREVVECPTGPTMFITGFSRAWTVVYFNPSIRDALVTLLKVISRLGPLAALMFLSFMGHYFTLQGLAWTEGIKGEFGFGDGCECGDCEDCDKFNDIPEWEALWILFVCLSEMQVAAAINALTKYYCMVYGLTPFSLPALPHSRCSSWSMRCQRPSSSSFLLTSSPVSSG